MTGPGVSVTPIPTDRRENVRVAPSPPAPPLVRLAWPLVVLFGVIVAGFVGLYALAPSGSKPDLAPLFGLFSGIPAALAALAAYSQSKRNAKIVEYHGQVLGKIDSQTNGQLDQRIVTAVGQAIDERPALLTDAAVAKGVAELLAQHLPDTGMSVLTGPATVSTITTVTPASTPTAEDPTP